jgi:CRISPR/Cas system CSM-associated protein Csm3 (group 7 of RAMP superfamily)
MKKGILLLTGKIKLLSPALIGSGRSEMTEMDVILDYEGKPFIPATSLVGILKSRIRLKGNHQKELKSFWGYSEDKEGSKSALSCSDLMCSSENVNISTRDGIAIDSLTGIVKPAAKYDYQVIEPGAEFHLHMEILIKENEEIESNKKNNNDKRPVVKSFYKNMISLIIAALKSGNLHLGAKTNNGLGKIQLCNEKLLEVDFGEKDHVKQWFKYLRDKDLSVLPIAEKESPFVELDTCKTFTIEAEFQLENSFIIRSYSNDPNAPDSASLRSSKGYVISGSSIKGAVRSRAERILNTLGKPLKIIDDLFGYVKEEDGTKAKGRIIIEETILPDYQSELQTRIKIDRFTGGTIKGALFESMPLFKGKNDERTFKIKMIINEDPITKKIKNHEAGLILLVLKDLWTGDLAVGGEKNVGRGVLLGISANISWDNNNFELKEPVGQLTGDKKKKLEEFVESLVNYKEGGD